MKVLLVDDERDILEILSLAFAGHEVVTAINVDDALKALETQTFQLVVTDIRLPGRPTSELLTRLSVLQPPVPAIVITGHGELPEGTPAVFRFLRKPFRRAELLKAAAEAVPGDNAGPKKLRSTH
jgi:DNA-binding NtrC family response regulator